MRYRAGRELGRFAAVVVLALLVTMPWVAATRAQAAPKDAATCDRLAAAAYDRDRPAGAGKVHDIAKADVAAAIAACTKAVNAPRPERRMWVQLGRAYEFGGRMKEAVAAYRQGSSLGSSTAMVGLGVLLARGAGAPTDAAEARRLFQAAADLGDVTGMGNLAASFGGALPGPVDFAAARLWYGKAAEAGYEEAMYQLGLMNHDGDGAPKDEVAAKAWLEKAAAADFAGAYTVLGDFAANGIAGPKDEQLAMRHYQRAIDLGDDGAREPLQRLTCPFVLKDKDGKAAGHVCFDPKP